MKFKEYVDGVNKMLEEHPEYGDMEMEQAFFPKIRESLKDKVPRGYVIDSVFKVIERMKTEEGIDLSAIYRKSPKQAYDTFLRFVIKNYDL